MKTVKDLHRIRRATAFSTLLAVFLCSSMLILGAPGRQALLGEIVISGLGGSTELPFAKVNGERAVSGRTLASSSIIETSETTSANISLGGLGQVSLFPNSAISLSFSETSISGTLHSGKIRIVNAKGASVNIQTPDNALSDKSGLPGSFTIDLRSGTTVATAETSSVQFTDGQPVKQAQTTSSGGSGLWIPLAVYGAIVGAAVISVIVNRNNDAGIPTLVVSPVR